MTDHRQLKIIVTGDFQSPEFRSPDFRDSLQGSDVSFLEWQELSRQSPVNFLFVAQSRRNQFSQSEMDRLVTRFPLTQKSIILGSWCEGETRSGQPLQGIHRIYRRDFAIFLRSAIAEYRATGTTSLARPVTESRADFLCARRDTTQSSGRLNVGVNAQTPEFFSTIADFCATRGWQAARLGERQKFDLIIAECYYSIDEAISLGQRLSQESANVPMVVICGFPRVQDQRQLREQIGDFELLGKPFDNQILETAVKRLLQNGKLQVISEVA